MANTAKLYQKPNGNYIVDLPTIQKRIEFSADGKIAKYTNEIPEKEDQVSWDISLMTAIENARQSCDKNLSLSEIDLVMGFLMEKIEDGDTN